MGTVVLMSLRVIYFFFLQKEGFLKRYRPSTHGRSSHAGRRKARDTRRDSESGRMITVIAHRGDSRVGFSEKKVNDLKCS